MPSRRPAAWNTGTCMYMIWTCLGCLILFANSIVWRDNITNWAPVWCDISTRYIIGASVGIPASSLCIIRRLYYITKMQSLSQGRQERKREVIIDICIGVGFPCIIMTLQYVVQGHRFDIFEEIGCWPATYNTLPAYFLVFMWPAVIGMISIVYAALTFRQAYIHKKRLNVMLASSCHISAGRYYRLMALCVVEAAFTVPLGIYTIVFDARNHIYPYISWANVHLDFSHIRQFPSVYWQTLPKVVASLEFSRWCYILCACVLFAFFGCGKEALESYRRAFQVIVRWIGLKSSQSTASKTTDRPSALQDRSIESLPVFTTRTDIESNPGSDTCPHPNGSQGWMQEMGDGIGIHLPFPIIPGDKLLDFGEWFLSPSSYTSSLEKVSNPGT